MKEYTMPLTNRLYYAQIAADVWADWVQVINVSGEVSKDWLKLVTKTA
jgi:hypothetical protein